MTPTEYERCLSLLRDSTAPLALRVEAGAKIWSLMEGLKDSLESFKLQLRAEARSKIQTGVGQISFEGAGFTSAQVTITPPLVRVQGLNLKEAQEVLGPDFDRIFKVTVTTRPDASPVLDTLGDKERRYVSGVVTLEDSTPRVSFKSLPGVTPTK